MSYFHKWIFFAPYLVVKEVTSIIFYLNNILIPVFLCVTWPLIWKSSCFFDIAKTHCKTRDSRHNLGSIEIKLSFTSVETNGRRNLRDTAESICRISTYNVHILIQTKWWCLLCSSCSSSCINSFYRTPKLCYFNSFTSRANVWLTNIWSIRFFKIHATFLVLWAAVG